ncbi:peptidase domain-containing ABC transporter [Gilvibacter sediminis]|uniref:peptidase domain-containing ABC transporter n=1 Tax=Gilvibacter sediminis TaxID=379071 RepID=UPI002350787E|nr:ATP-binding cassette domain-containing protein [Gilvibacter sediminis]MDC7997261.1 ATP-binding cassette domain-containing protein [Gilvibacter sediminis]
MSQKIIYTPWKRLTEMLELDRKDVLQVFYYAIFAGAVSLSLPLGIQAIINLIQGAQISSSWIVLVILVTLGTAFVGALQLMQFRIIENIQQKIFTRASFEFAYRFPKIQLSELRNYYPPELANRFFDTLTVQKGLSKILVDFPAALLQIIFGLLLLSLYHPFFIAYGILLLLFLYLLFRVTAMRGMSSSLEESKNKYKVAHWIQEVARTVVSFKLSGKTSLALRKNDNLVVGYLGAREKHFKVLVIQFIQLIGFKVLVTAGLLLIGGILVLNQEMNIGQFVAAEIIIITVINSVEKLITGLETIYDVLTSLEKIGQVVDKEIEPQEGDESFLNAGHLDIELKEIGLTVPGHKQPILKDINLNIVPGSRTWINGENGSGKTTLLRVISGIIPPTNGQMFVNSVARSTIHLSKFRALVGQTLSEESPFEGTLLENITFGDADIPRERVNWAIENVGLMEFVKSLDDGIDTILYPEGRQIPLTIGKKILLARAIVHAPKLLLLKDPLDHFKAEEARRLRAFLTDKSHPWTLIVVSQDEEWGEFCDTTITMEKGAIK